MLSVQISFDSILLQWWEEEEEAPTCIFDPLRKSSFVIGTLSQLVLNPIEVAYYPRCQKAGFGALTG